MLKSNIIINGIKPSRIALGTHTFCNATENASKEILDEYFSNGGNIIDTGRCYGGDVTNPIFKPESERCIGSWLKSSGMRNKTILITKGGNHEFKNGKLVKHRITPQDIEADICMSLEELKTDYIDIYFLHKDNPNIEPGKAIEILSKYVKNGIVKHIGASNWCSQRIGEANQYAIKHNLPRFEYSELAFSLKDGVTIGWKDQLPWEMNATDYQYYQNNNITVLGYTSQAYGYFYNDSNIEKATGRNLEIFKRLKELCFKKQINMHEALFGFYFGCDINNIPIISAKNISRLKEVLDNCNVVLDFEEIEYLLEARFNLKML